MTRHTIIRSFVLSLAALVEREAMLHTCSDQLRLFIRFQDGGMTTLVSYESSRNGIFCRFSIIFWLFKFLTDSCSFFSKFALTWWAWQSPGWPVAKSWSSTNPSVRWPIKVHVLYTLDLLHLVCSELQKQNQEKTCFIDIGLTLPTRSCRALYFFVFSKFYFVPAWLANSPATSAGKQTKYIDHWIMFWIVFPSAGIE